MKYSRLKKADDSYDLSSLAFPVGARVQHIMNGQEDPITSANLSDYVTVQWDNGTIEDKDIYLLKRVD